MSGLSFNNRHVQQLRRLIGRRSLRHADGLFVVEGPVLVAEAVAAGWTSVAQYVPAGSSSVVEGAGSVHELALGVYERIATTESPQPPLALMRMPEDRDDVATVLAGAGFVVVLDRLADPGNLGTIMRSAEAAGVDAIVLTPGSVDPYNPKVVRASAGALFHVPVVTATFDDVAGAGFRLVGSTSHDVAGRTVVPYGDHDWSGRVALVMGNEAGGLPAAWGDDAGPVPEWVTVPHRGRSESLNVAMAATLLVFEAARHRP